MFYKITLTSGGSHNGNTWVVPTQSIVVFMTCKKNIFQVQLTINKFVGGHNLYLHNSPPRSQCFLHRFSPSSLLTSCTNMRVCFVVRFTNKWLYEQGRRYPFYWGTSPGKIFLINPCLILDITDLKVISLIIK